MDARSIACLLLVVCGLAAGCGGAAAGRDDSTVPTPASLPLLPQSALPYLKVRERALPVSALMLETPVAGLGRRLDAWRYVAGREREFYGRAPGRLSHVVDRTLVFASPAGARAYVELLARNAGDFLGDGARVRPLALAGRHGYVLSPPRCGCHLERPVLTALLAGGRRATWLSITGDAVSRHALRRLALQLP